MNKASDYRPFVIGIIVLALIVISWLSVTQILLIRKNKTQRRNAEKLRWQLKSIQNQLNPHLINNLMVALTNLLHKKEFEKAQLFLGNLNQLTRKVLNYANNDFISLNEELEFIQNYLHLEQIRFQFDYEITIDENVDIFLTDVPPFLLQSFVENAIKHGISSIPERGNIQIILSENANTIHCKIIDNGIGFQSNQPKQNHGISINQERIKMLNQIYRTNIQLYYKYQSGTEVNILIPTEA